MKKILINSVLLLVFMGFLLIPNYPYLHYFLVNSKTTISNADVKVVTSKTLIGDIAYLNAIISRVDNNKQSNKKAPIPETNNHFTQLVFINNSNLNLDKLYKSKSKYSVFINPILNLVYLKIPSPPPQSLYI